MLCPATSVRLTNTVRSKAGHSMIRRRGGTTGQDSQRGATAMEFALVLPVFFLLFYGILTYGLIFLMRLGLQHAAEDGARAALRYPGTDCTVESPCDPDERLRAAFNARLLAAYTQARQQSQWMDGRADLNPLRISSRICPIGVACGVADAGVLACEGPDCDTGVPPPCGVSQAAACQVVVTVIYDYDAAPFIPRVLGFGLVTPAQLTGQARLLLDGRALSS